MLLYFLVPRLSNHAWQTLGLGLLLPLKLFICVFFPFWIGLYRIMSTSKYICKYDTQNTRQAFSWNSLSANSSFLPFVIELCPLAVCQTNMLLETHQFIILLLFSPFLDRIMSASSMLQCSFPFGRQMEGPMGGEGPPGCPFPLSTHTNYCTKFYCKVIGKTEIQGKGIEKNHYVTLL